jgi:O-antigen/teichoic acid export membrane protein
MILKQKIYNFLKWSEKYTGTDMIYLIKGGSWLVSGNVFSTLIGLAIMIVFDRFIPKETFGAYEYVLSIAAIISITSLPGINTALIRTVAKGNEKMLTFCFKEKLKWGLISGFSSLFIAFWYLSQQNYQLGISFLIVSLFLPFINSFTLFLSFWQGKKRFDIQNKYYVLSNLLVSASLILTVILTKNIVLIIFSFFFSSFLVNWLFYKLTTKKALLVKGGEEKETISFGKHLTLIQSINSFSIYIDKIILWKLLGPAAVAIYVFAERPVTKFHGLLPILDLALPKLSQANIKNIKKELFKKFLKLFIITIPIALIYIIICPYLYKVLFPSYLNSVPYSQIMALIIIFSPFGLLTTSLLAEIKKKELYILNFLTPSLKITLFLILIPFFGIWGVIYSVLISQLFNGALSFYFFKKI